ncbi:MAG: geranylgeranyl reductase family protein [Candidatus Ranarchaeia archaeon]
MSTYDIVIIGGGPAGLIAANKTSEAGLKTILIEKEKEIGLPLSCGEFLPSPKTIDDLLPNVNPKQKHLFEIEDEFISARIKQIRVILENGNDWSFPFDSFSIDRPKWEKGLAVKCLSNGCNIDLGNLAIGFSKEGVKTSKGVIKGKLYIAADGPSSKIAKWAGLKTNLTSQNLSPCQGYHLGNVKSEEDVVDMYFGSLTSPGGYAWIIPKGDNIANVGVGIRTTHMGDQHSLTKSLDYLMKKNVVSSKKLENTKVLKKISGLVPVGGPIEKTYTEKLMVTGDAAGMVMASNGGGIPTALVSGWLAANTAIENIEKGTSLEKYEKLWKDQMGEVLYSALEVRKMLDKIMPHPSLMSKMMSFAGPKRVGEMIQCRIPTLIKYGYKIFELFL